MQISKFNRVIILAAFSAILTSSAWCARVDKGGSSYGQDTQACPSGSGPATPATYGALTANCFFGNSGLTAALFEIKDNTTPFPSSFSVAVTFASPTTTDYGLLTCDNGNIPCIAGGNPVNFAGAPAFSPTGALFTFSNFTGDLVFYVNEAATLTNISPLGGSATPEPKNTAAAGLLLLCAIGLVRRFAQS
jgi:hypothetical protein